MTAEYIPGLEGVVAARTEISLVDGGNGRLVYRGYVIADLAEDMSFEEVAHLLWYGRLPTRAELDALTLELAGSRTLTPAAMTCLAVSRLIMTSSYVTPPWATARVDR